MSEEKNSLTNGQILDHLARTNDSKYNFEKFLEESTELSEVILKKITKAGTAKEPKDEDLIDELGDTIIRVDILRRIYGDDAVNTRIQKKLDKYREYIIDGKYTGRI